ncbi:hypothetical protein [Butyricicoccus sp.]|uniref:hypothetical protein n=1 Tax=Butyricicoccus sp. TaxID=2049021 RepID=UPI003F180987
MEKELYKELLAKEIADILVQRMDFDIDAEKLLELRSDQALEQIRQVIDDDTLSDPQCFERIEHIVCILEESGSSGGARHDFG